MSADLQEAEDRNRFRCLDLVLQPLVAIAVVADEADLLDAGLFAFVDLEHEVDAVVRQFDDLRLDADVETAVAAVDFDDALHVGLHQSGATACRAAFDCTSLTSWSSLIFLLPSKATRLITGFSTTVTIRRAAGLVDAHVLEQAGGVERLQRLVDLVGVEPLARAGAEIGADGVGFDPAVAFDDDRRGAVAQQQSRRRDREPRRRRKRSRRGPRRPGPGPEAAAPTTSCATRPFGPHTPTERRYCGTYSLPCLYRLFPTLQHQQRRISPFSRRRLSRQAPLTTPIAAAAAE